MADFSKFRSSLGGFHRGDVANYIESLSMQHAAAMKEKSGQIDALQAELLAARQKLEEAEEEKHALQIKLDDALAALEAATAPAEDEAEDETEAEVEEAPDYPKLELEAYRRAEATERLATQRAQQLKRELVDFLENTTARYQQTGEDIAALAEDLKSGLKRLEENLSELDLLFGETAEHLETLTPAEPLEVE